LRQIVAASGVDPAELLDLHELAGALFELAKRTQGDAGVLRTAAEGERNLKAEYDQAIEGVPDQEAKALLDKQRRDVAFSEQVLRSIRRS
jgi:hypothetical protein